MLNTAIHAALSIGPDYTSARPPCGRLRPVRLRVAAVALVALSFGLRVLQLSSQSLWDNETHPVYMARRGLQYILQHLEADHVLLHYALLAGWGSLAGWSEFAVRFLSVCAGVLTVPLLFQVLRLARLRWFAVVGVAALSVAPFHIYYSQETRMYALACLLVTLAAYAAVRAWQRRSNLH